MSARRYDLYGWITAELDDIARAVEAALPVRLEPRSSLYRGEYYNWRGAEGGHLVVQENVVEDDGAPTESDFPRHRVLIYASELPRGWFDDIASLAGAERLRSELRP